MTETKAGDYPHPRRGKTKRTFYPTDAWLHARYIDDGLSEAQIRELTGYSKTGLSSRLRKLGVPVKGRSLPRLAITREELYQLHVVEGLTAVRIAARFGCNNSAVSRLIKRYGIEPGRALVNVPATPLITRDELWSLYWVEGLSTAQVAERFGVAKSTVQRWMRLLEVEARRWNGGTVHRVYVRTSTLRSRNGQEFNAQERERIFVRDRHVCRMPGCASKDRLETHHILPIKYGGTHALENGITLCHQCHERVKYREMTYVLIFLELALNPPTR